MKFRRSRNRRPTQNMNIKNQVFDSSGPNGKIRGTAQQLYEKYTGLARDSSSGLNADRILAESYHQFADHYYRLLLEARLVEIQHSPSQQSQPRYEPDGGQEDWEPTQDQTEPAKFEAKKKRALTPLVADEESAGEIAAEEKAKPRARGRRKKEEVAPSVDKSIDVSAEKGDPEVSKAPPASKGVSGKEMGDRFRVMSLDDSSSPNAIF